jgi:hypothetical protein
MERGARHGGHIGQRLRERLDRLLLVQWVAERPQERHRECLDALAFDEEPRRGDDLARVEWPDDVAVAVHALVDADDAAR